MAEVIPETAEMKPEIAPSLPNQGAGPSGANNNRGGGGPNQRGGPMRRNNQPRGNRFSNNGNFPPRQGGGGGNPRFNHDDNRGHQDGHNDDRGGNRERKPGPNQNRVQNGGNNRFQNDRETDRIADKLFQLRPNTHDLPPIDTVEKKFSGRSRLYIGNMTSDVTEDEITELFKPFGELNEVFLNKEKMFGFVRVDYYANAERAKRELNGQMRKGRPLKVRFAPSNSSVRVKNLTPCVTNELLYHAFSVFGDVDRAIVIVDERGRSTCEGIVEFSRKPAAMCAIRRCQENCFFLTASLRPVIVEAYEPNDEIDGYPERSLGTRRIQDFYKERDQPPRFAAPNSFEHEYGTRWKQLAEIYKQKIDALQKEKQMEEEKLEAQMEYARYEHETELLKEQLRAREADRDRQKREWELKERQVEEEKLVRESELRRQQENMLLRMSTQEEELRRRQEENNLFMKARQLSNMLEQQERFDTTIVGGGGHEGGSQEPKSLMEGFERRGGQRNFDERKRWNNQGGGNRGRNDNFMQNKRRRL